MPFRYQSGEEIMLGDHVLLHGEPGEIEFIADPASDPETREEEENWYVTELGGGVLILEPKVFGRLFLSEPEKEQDLILVGRRDQDVRG